MNESVKTWIKIGLSVLTFLVAIGIWVGKIDSDVQDLKKKSGRVVTSSSIDLEDIAASLELPNYKIEQNFQAIQKLQESQIEIQKHNATLTVILEALEKRVTRGGN